ncbi:MAG: major capsid protein [Melioribacteraceae bacterium]|nr:major capsid protein [Melioribacteraceae bacterium]
MGTLDKQRIVDPVLTNLARGYSNDGFVANMLFPLATVNKEGGKIPQFTKEAFKIYNTERAIRADSNRINPSVNDSIDFVLAEHDLEYPMDYREINESALPLKMHATNVVTEAIALRKEKLAADLAINTANYAATNKIALGAGDHFDEATSDPIGVIDAARSAVRSQIAKNPNVIVIPNSVFTALKNHAAITDKVKYTQHAVITAQLLKQLLQFDALYVASGVYENAAGNLVDIWGESIVMAYVPEAKNGNRSFYEPSYGYTLQMKNFPIVDTYDEKGKVKVVRNTDLFVPKIVGADAGYLISDCLL